MEYSIRVIHSQRQGENWLRSKEVLLGKVHVKNGVYFIRYAEGQEEAQVLLKWYPPKRIELKRMGVVTNQFHFNEQEQTTLMYHTPIGMIPLMIETLNVTGYLNLDSELSHLEWSYLMKQEKEILGEYHVQLDFSKQML